MITPGAGHRSVRHLAQDLRVAVSLTRHHARILLDEGERVGKEHRRSLEVIQRQVSRLDRLVDELRARRPEDDEAPASLPSSGPRRPRVLIADDDPDFLESLAQMLGTRYDVEAVSDGSQALDRLRAADFDLAILDQHIPEMTGLQVAELLSTGPRAPPAFLFVSGDRGAELKVRGLLMGDYVTKPVEPSELLARVARTIALLQRERSLIAEAMSDPLTGLANYRSLTRNLEIELDRARRYDQPLSLLTIDLDGLKNINDKLGHAAGNDAIRIVASVLTSAVRKFETVARQGGDEFSILLPNASGAEAVLLGERLCSEVAQRSVRDHALSISVGVASREPGDDSTTVQSLVDASDAALYSSKQGGRNRVSERPRG